jgi:hypothetical protein
LKKLFLHKLFPAVLFFAAAPAWAATVWNGPSLLYVQPGADPTQPANQDRLTSDVWLTRSSTRGLFNAAMESSFANYSSPAGTEWAYGELANYASLSYHNWEAWNGQAPPSSIGQDAVLHLIPDDIYLSFRLDSWGARGPGFSYDRSTPGPVPEPSITILLLATLPLAVVLRRRHAAIANKVMPQP